MFYLPASDPKDWKRLLADPDKHWCDGYSAKSLAECWQGANGFPKSVRKILETSQYSQLHDLTFLAGFPEYKVNLPGGSRASQNDIFVLASNSDGLISIMIEGKVDEPFGPLVSEWIKYASNGKKERLSYILSLLGLVEVNVLPIRYQLLHRTASAIIESQRFHCSATLMLVHSFSKHNSSFEDYESFVQLLGKQGTVNGVVGPISINPVPLFFGWLCEKSILSLPA